MLRSIAAAASRLPEGEFDEEAGVNSLRVHGKNSATELTVNIAERLSREGDDVTRFTVINLGRSATDPRLLTELEADTYVTDDIGETYCSVSQHETFALGDADSDLSMKRVMRYMRLAARTVEGARTLEYLARPEAGMPQVF